MLELFLIFTIINVVEKVNTPIARKMYIENGRGSAVRAGINRLIMISQDIEVLILECCGPKEVGRCATASHGLRTAARLSWKSLATRKFPLLTSIAHAASQLPDAKPFDYASAYHSHLHLRVSPPRLDDLEDLGDVVESLLPRIVVTYELCQNGGGQRPAGLP